MMEKNFLKKQKKDKKYIIYSFYFVKFFKTPLTSKMGVK